MDHDNKDFDFLFSEFLKLVYQLNHWLLYYNKIKVKEYLQDK